MLRHLGVLSVAGSLAILPAPVAAQKAMAVSHELGVDVAVMYQKLSLGGVSANHILIGTPVDVRLGFVPKGKAKYMFEPRFVLMFDSKDPTTGQSAYVFTPDLNVLFAKNQRKGMYWTVGAGIDLLHGGGASASQIGINGGIGTRSPWESGARRMEAFLQYKLKNTGKGLPSQLNIGGRIGLSLWH
jgi:hypothetical protein